MKILCRFAESTFGDGSVRGTITKGLFVLGAQHPRIFGRGHIGRGWTNIAPNRLGIGLPFSSLAGTVALYDESMSNSGMLKNL